MLAAKEKTASLEALFAQPKTRVWGLPLDNQNGIGGSSPVTSTHDWGWWHVYAGTASGALDNRYYSNAYGRFMTPDPYSNSGRLNDPQSWNRYAYTRGDPVNRFDPKGTDDSVPYECYIDPDGMYDPACAAANCAAYGFVDASCDNNGWGPIDTFQEPGGGGGGGVPPLTCFPMTYTTQAGQYFAPGTTTAPTGYFGDPIELGFEATGGTGNYTFSVIQTIFWIGTVTYDTGAGLVTLPTGSPITTIDGLFPGQLSASQGIGYTLFYFHDAPGVLTDAVVINNPRGASTGTAVAASATMYASTTGWVSDGQSFVPCGTYEWSATITWPLGQAPSGEATVASVSGP